MKNQIYAIVTFFVIVYLISFNQKVEAQSNFPSLFPDRVILNLTEDPTNSIAVTWRTSMDMKEGFCEVVSMTPTRIKPEDIRSLKATTTYVKYEYKEEPVIQANQHSCMIDNLEPGKEYLYRVGTKDYWSEWFEFKTPANDDKPFSFIYFGDPQANLKSEWSRVVRKSYNYVPDCSFMLYGGDIINRANRDTEWNEWFIAGSYIFSSVPQVLTPGNHDYDGPTLDSHWKYQFTQPQNGPAKVKGTCFAIDYKDLKLISLDSAVEEELEDENGEALQTQKVWLDSVLAANTKKWIIVTTHLPFYSPKASRDNVQLRKHFQPILEKYNVDLVLNGHDHSYGRGMASDFSDTPSIMYVVSVSGPKLYDAGDKDWMQKSGGNLQLFQQITIDNNMLIFKAFSADGNLFDQFTLKRRKDGTTKLLEMRAD